MLAVLDGFVFSVAEDCVSIVTQVLVAHDISEFDKARKTAIGLEDHESPTIPYSCFDCQSGVECGYLHPQR